MTQDKVTALNQRIGKLQSSINGIDQIITADGATMTDDQLDQATRERTTAQARMVALQAALAGEQGKGEATILQAAIDAKKSAAAECAKAALERADAAADIDASITALIASTERYIALNSAMRVAAFDAGLRDQNARAYSTDLRPISATLAARLSGSGIAAQLDFVQVAGTQHTRATVAEATAAANRKLLGAVERVAA